MGRPLLRTVPSTWDFAPAAILRMRWPRGDMLRVQGRGRMHR